MATGLTYVNGSTCYLDSNFVRVGNGPSTLYDDAVFSFSIGDSSMASINSVRIYFKFDNTDAGEGFSGTFTYICGLSSNGSAGRIVNNDPNCKGYNTVSITGSASTGYVDINTGGTILPNTTYYVRWNFYGSSYSTLKNFNKYVGQSIDILTSTPSNHAPYWSGASVTVTSDGITNNVIREDYTSVTVSWSQAYDQDGDTLTYTVYRVTSSHGYKVVYTGTSRTYNDTTFTTDGDVYVEKGQNWHYDVHVTDEHGLSASSAVSSNNIIRNNLTTAILSNTGSIAFATTSIVMSRTNPSNLNGNTSFTYNLSCDKVTVYNPTVDLTTDGDLVIWRTGDATPSVPYIKFSEIATALQGTSYNGTFVFTLSTSNIYGTSKTTTVSISIDLRIAPLWTTQNFAYSGGYTINSHLYYLPDVRAITLSWSAATEQIAGGTITYDVEYKLSSASEWTKVGSDITATTIDITPSSSSSQLTYNVRVTAKTSYSTSNQKTPSNLLIDKYLRPSFGLTTKKRKTSSVEITLNITPRTTILTGDYSISTLRFLKCDEVTYVNLPTTDWTPTFEYGVTPYTDANFTKTTSYTMICQFNDSIGSVLGGSYATAMSLSIPITAYIPMFSIRKLGVAINDINDGVGNFIFKIKGKMNSVSDDSGNAGYYVNGVNILLLAHPVGELYWSSESTSPATLFGGGTWVQVKDKFILAAGDTYTSGATGGEATHTLTIPEIPSHQHQTSGFGVDLGSNNLGVTYSTSSAWETWGVGAITSTSTGGGGAHNNMPPYEVAYCWKRTA